MLYTWRDKQKRKDYSNRNRKRNPISIKTAKFKNSSLNDKIRLTNESFSINANKTYANRNRSLSKYDGERELTVNFITQNRTKNHVNHHRKFTKITES